MLPLGQILEHVFAATRTLLCRIAMIDLDDASTSLLSFVLEHRDELPP
jgi:hypothetical protein